ncbi:hypothetical protein CONLIGDRAFT_685908 [Coniochaeta ligniaria NRRL 30616]|uniref:Uncharacterized protein n=1 Tax=Coniochaeta ligniaria NRRL 30616 TaxID=1408157 RepID=A0A1J7IA04_9PEZI|nr:hypothetical protein CONLIGDRAFT_685908 [Coniochaeta ligniaria NRRL 30616]
MSKASIPRSINWLGWVPEKATEVHTFNRGEHMVPDCLKYAWDQLFIPHGQDSFKCRKNTKLGSDGRKEASNCPLENLLDRIKAVSDEEEAVDAKKEQAAEGGPDNNTTELKKAKHGKGKKKVNRAEEEEQVDGKEDQVDESKGQADSNAIETVKKTNSDKEKKKDNSTKNGVHNLGA